MAATTTMMEPTRPTAKNNFHTYKRFGTLDTSETSQTSALFLVSSICSGSSITTRSILEELCTNLSSQSLGKELRRDASSHGDMAVLTPTVGFGHHTSHTSHTSPASLDNFVSSMATLQRSLKSPSSSAPSSPARQTEQLFLRPQLVSPKNRQRKVAQLLDHLNDEDDVDLPRPQSPQYNKLPFRPSRQRSLSLGDDPTCSEERKDACATPRSQIMSEYEIGEEVRSTSDLSLDVKTIRNLNEGDGAFIKRSDGSFTFAVVKRRDVEMVSGFSESKGDVLVFFASSSKKRIKFINQKKWSSCIIGAANHVIERRHG